MERFWIVDDETLDEADRAGPPRRSDRDRRSRECRGGARRHPSAAGLQGVVARHLRVPLVHDARLPGTQDRDHAAGPCVGAGGRADIPADVRDPGRPRAATCTALPWPGFLVEESRAWVADLASPDRVWSLAYVADREPALARRAFKQALSVRSGSGTPASPGPRSGLRAQADGVHTAGADAALGTGWSGRGQRPGG